MTDAQTTEPAPPEPRRTLRAVAVDFWLYWVGQTVSNLGRAFSSFAFPLIIYRLGGGPQGLALIVVALFLPNLLFGIFVGAWCDRLNRKVLMVAMDVARFAVLAVVGGIGVAGGLEPWMLFVAAFCTATFDLAFESSQAAVVPALVPDRADFVKANSRMMAGVQIGALGGPILAGMLVLLLPVPAVLLADASSYLVSGVSLLLVSRSFNRGGSDTRRTSTIVQDAVAGLRYMVRQPTMRSIMLIATLTHLFGATAMAEIVLFASKHLQAGPTKISVLYAAEGVAALLLSFTASYAARRIGHGRSMLLAIGVRGALLIALVLTPWYWLAVPLWGIAVGVQFFFSIHSASVSQSIVPNDMLGRVSSVGGLMISTAIPVSVLIGGWVLEHARVETVFLGMGVLTLLIPIVFRLFGGVIRDPEPVAAPQPVAAEA
ncbi:MAG: MFS transporter [Actinocatenispora sp.]